MPEIIFKDIKNKEYIIKTSYCFYVNTMENTDPCIGIYEVIKDNEQKSKTMFDTEDEAKKCGLKEIIRQYNQKYENNINNLNSLRSKMFVLKNKILGNKKNIDAVKSYISKTNKYKEMSEFYNDVLEGKKETQFNIQRIDSNLSDNIGPIPIGQKLYQLDYHSLTNDNVLLVSTATISDFKILNESIYLEISVEKGYFPFKIITINLKDIKDSKIDITKGIPNYSSIKYFTDKNEILNEIKRAKSLLSSSPLKI